MTLEEYAKIYVETITSQPNGWGQCVHPIYGKSEGIMLFMTNLFGEKATQKAIDEEFYNIMRNK